MHSGWNQKHREVRLSNKKQMARGKNDGTVNNNETPRKSWAPRFSRLALAHQSVGDQDLFILFCSYYSQRQLIHQKQHTENKKKKKQAQKAFFSINFLFPKSGLHQGKKKMCSPQKMYAWHWIWNWRDVDRVYTSLQHELREPTEKGTRAGLARGP